MKARLNLTIDERLLMEVKKIAQKNDTSVSELVEHFFKQMIASTPIKQNTIIDLVEKLAPPDITPRLDLKELYYRESYRYTSR